MPEVYWGYLRAIYRERKAQTGDESVAMFAMVRQARIDGCPNSEFDKLVETLREEGAVT